MFNLELDNKPGEKCAVVGVLSTDGAVIPAIEALRALQHRGQEASGISCMQEDGSLINHREPGLVRDVYSQEAIIKLKGNLAIGHNRYSTNGDRFKHLQPVVDDSIGFAFAHNGNLPDTKALEAKLKKHNIITSRLNDSEMMARIIAIYIRDGKRLPEAVEKAYRDFKGAFSCVAMHGNHIVAFRDERGIRPLALGKHDKGWIVASETCAMDAIGAKYIRELNPGEMLILSPMKKPVSIQLSKGEERLDIFEFVYFARPDSQLYGQRVSEVRRRFGEELALEHGEAIIDKDNTIVVPVPDTSIPASEGFSDALNLKHRQAIVKDRYIARTFILPDQAGREQQLRRKHNIIPEAIIGKDVILIDDSIVRLNTMPKIVKRMYEAGAKSVIVLIASPPVRFPDYYGMDTPSQDELVAANHTIKEMTAMVGTNYLGFLPISKMVKATHISAEKFNLSCFNKDYPVSIGSWQKTIRDPVSTEYMD